MIGEQILPSIFVLSRSDVSICSYSELVIALLITTAVYTGMRFARDSSLVFANEICIDSTVQDLFINIFFG